jgi:hypothetical protein
MTAIITQPREVWILKGIVRNPSSYHVNLLYPELGDPEYRIYDEKPSKTVAGYFAGYREPTETTLSLEGWLTANPGCTIHMLGEAEDSTLYDRWHKFINQPGSLITRIQEIADAAYDQGILGQLLEALEERRS